MELHPGLIVLRESGLSRIEQWERLEAALRHILAQADPNGYMVNRIIEVAARDRIRSLEVPPP